MPLTENELRDLLRERSAAAPTSPDRVGAVRTRVARQRRRELAVVSGALALVVAAGALWALPGQSATPVPPASPSPSVPGGEFTTTAMIDGITASVTGPSVVDGVAPFDLTLRVDNPESGSVWRGRVAAGLLYDQLVPGYFDGDVLTSTDGSGVNLGATLPASVTTRAFGGVQMPDTVVLAPGDTRVWTFSVARNPAVAVPSGIRGWLAYLVADGTGIVPSSGRAVTFTPSGSSLACAAVTGLTWQRGTPGAWGLESVSTATVGADGSARWVEVPGVDAAGGTTFTSTQTRNVQASTVIATLGAAGAAEASGYGAELPDMPSTLEAGRYVAYAAVRMVAVTFAGTCGPSGEPISGTWTAYADRAAGVLDCDVVAAAALPQPGAAASAYCAKG